MQDNLTLIHLSDLHMQKKNIKDVNIVINALKKDLKDFRKDHSVNYDGICFSGDLIQRGDYAFEDENQFYLAEEHFLMPILTELNLDYDKFYFSPGNHEVNRSKIDIYQDHGFKSELLDRDSINKFIDGLKEGYLERTSEFLRFRSQNFESYCNTKNLLYSTFILNKNQTDIGIACLNSCWLSSGDNDYGNLIVGERQIDDAYQDVSKCNFKIAVMHHPTHWLAEHDKRAVELALNKFNLVLTGHLHDTKGIKTYTKNQSNIISSCGSLFNGSRSNIYNGYTIINVDFSKNTVTLYFREFFDDRREFDKSLRICKDGQDSFKLNQEKKSNLAKTDYVKNVKDKLIEKFNNKLIPSLLKNLAPKELKKMFVEPNLSWESEYKKEEDTSNSDVALSDLLESNNNLIFIGKSETGKTTLLNYICLHYLENFSRKFKTPFILDFNELPKGKDVLEKYIINFLMDYDYSITKKNIQDLLDAGDCIVLIDNFNIDNKKHLKYLNEFINNYRLNRFIITSCESFIRTISLEKFPSLEMNHDKIYLHTLDRNKIRMLIKNWFSARDDVNVENILNKITSNLHNINMPTTPLIISLMLAVCEEHNNFEPINEAALIERFIELILEKISIDDIKISTYDFKNKEDYLSYLAWEMVVNDKYCFSEHEYFNLTYNYHNEKALDLKASNFDSIFFNKGILFKGNGKVYFRYKCFYEYFVARKMLDNNDAYDFIINSPGFLQFYNEMVFLSGLQRNNKNLLSFLANKLYNFIEVIKEDVDIKNLSKLNISYLFHINEDALINMEENKLDVKEKDKVLDRNPVKNTFEEQIISKEDLTVSSNNLMHLLTLYARVLKNCELLDKQHKLDGLNLCIESYCFTIAVIIKAIESNLTEEELSELLNDETNEDKINNEGINVIKDLFKTTIPIVFQNLIYETVGTSKLDKIIVEYIEKCTNDFINFMLVFLYADLDLPNYIDYIRKFTSRLKSKDLLNLSFFKLYYYYIVRDLTKTEEDSIRSVISDIMISLNRGNKYQKGHLISLLKESKKDLNTDAKSVLMQTQ